MKTALAAIALVASLSQAIAQTATVASPPPVCNGPNQALQSNGLAWNCITISAGSGTGTGGLPAAQAVYAENDQANAATTMIVTVNWTNYSSSIAGHGYVAGDVIGFYFDGTTIVNSKSSIAGATYLFALPLVGGVTLAPNIPQGGVTQFTVVDNEVFYTNPPMLSTLTFTHPTPAIYNLSFDLKPWVPAGARKASFNMDAEIHSAGAVVGGAILNISRGNIKNISLYPTSVWWAAQDVKVDASLKYTNQTFGYQVNNNGGGIIDNILAYAFVEGFKQ